MIARKRFQLIRGILSVASSSLAWWLFYLTGIWSGSARLPVLYLCFFFSAVGINEVLSMLVDLLSIANVRRREQRPSLS